MLTNDHKDDGVAAWKALKSHFSSTETPRLMNLLEKFTSLRLELDEGMVNYLTRAEYMSTQLDLAGEKVSETLLTSIVLKGLPPAYEYFKTVHDFFAKFSEVKKALRNFEDSRKLASSKSTTAWPGSSVTVAELTPATPVSASLTWRTQFWHDIPVTLNVFCMVDSFLTPPRVGSGIAILPWSESLFN